MKFLQRIMLALVLAVPFFAPAVVDAQVAQCRATTSAPTYTNGSTGALSCDLNGNLRSNITDGSGALNVIVDSGSLTSNAFSAAVSLTRTSDTNVYAAGDILGAATGSTAALTFANMCPSAGRVMLTTAAMEVDSTAVISGQANYRLYLYNVTPPSALGDNTAWDLPAGDRASFLGYVDLGTPVDLGSTLYVQTTAINQEVKCAGTSLFGYLVTIAGYTPASATVHVITLADVGL